MSRSIEYECASPTLSSVSSDSSGDEKSTMTNDEERCPSVEGSRQTTSTIPREKSRYRQQPGSGGASTTTCAIGESFTSLTSVCGFGNGVACGSIREIRSARL